jgi:hypothetical protein
VGVVRLLVALRESVLILRNQAVPMNNFEKRGPWNEEEQAGPCQRLRSRRGEVGYGVLVRDCLAHKRNAVAALASSKRQLGRFFPHDVLTL